MRTRLFLHRFSLRPQGDVVCCAPLCSDRTDCSLAVERYGCGCAYHARAECLPPGDECVSCAQRYERVLRLECDARNATIADMVAELSQGGPAAPLVDDEDDSEEGDDDLDAADEREPRAAALGAILGELWDERQRTADWLGTL